MPFGVVLTPVMHPKSVLTEQEFVALKEGDVFRDVDGQEWSVLSNVPIERDSNLPGTHKIQVRDSSGEIHFLVWDTERNLILDDSLEELLSLQTF